METRWSLVEMVGYGQKRGAQGWKCRAHCWKYAAPPWQRDGYREKNNAQG